MLKKLILAILLAAATTAPSTFAATVSLSDIPNAGSTGGGEFRAVTTDHGTFRTFCLEAVQGINLETPYKYTISDSAQSQGDPLSLATAWLYNEFLNGTLAGIVGGALSGLYIQSNEDANALQNAIWYLEGEGGANNAYAQKAVATVGNGDANGAYGVHVMNVWSSIDPRTGRVTGDKQDQLIRVPDGGTTLALLGMSMGFVAFASRRMRR